MSTTFLIACVIAAVILLCSSSSSSGCNAVVGGASSHHDVVSQVWLCLERCGYNKTDAQQQIRDIAQHAPAISTISVEAFDLGPGATVINNRFSNMTADILKHGMIPVAMLTTVSVDLIRQAIANPHALAANVVNACHELGVRGIDFDWEPSTKDSALAAGYATLLSTVSEHLARANLTMSADVATWSAIWSFSDIAKAAALQRPTLMSTYAADNAVFQKELTKALTYFSSSRVVVGFDVQAVQHEADIAMRFALLRKHGLCRVAFWQAPMVSAWWPFIDAHMRACSNKDMTSI